MGRQGPHPQLDARVAVQPRFGRRHDRLFAGGELAQGGRHLPAGLVFGQAPIGAGGAHRRGRAWVGVTR
jgi:hypothetical protein